MSIQKQVEEIERKIDQSVKKSEKSTPGFAAQKKRIEQVKYYAQHKKTKPKLHVGSIKKTGKG